MGRAEEKKKKGRPSLLDLQKRNIKQQHELPLNSPTPLLRSTRRNPNIDEFTSDNDRDEDDNQGPESIGFGDASASDSNHKKRKTSGFDNGSGFCVMQKEQRQSFGTNKIQGLDLGPSTPLPDKKLLLFILDRLQKKDTRRVFSEPVDSEELPDYHDIVKHPMDFGTVRKKLACGAYAKLEQFEKDVFLISSNAMEYNAPDTMYFRQARAIHELAKKSFENLRQGSDNNEPEPKIVRRGRPPTKHLKKPIGRPPLERVPSGFSSDATPATGLGSTILSNHDLKKGTISPEKSATAHSYRNICSGWLADNKFENNDESRGSTLKGNSLKNGKKPFYLEENRRDTYKQSHQLAGGWETSVIPTLGEKKQLMAVGLFPEHGFTRSLARFAASLGPIAWNVASKKIERSLPAAVNFGPGWVGDSDATQQSAHVASLPSSDRLLKPTPFL